MKSILSYGQAIKACKQAIKPSFSDRASVAISAGDALRDGYKLKNYVKKGEGVLGYWVKQKDKT